MVRVQNLFALAIVIVLWTRNYLIFRLFYMTGLALSANGVSASFTKTTVREASVFCPYSIGDLIQIDWVLHRSIRFLSLQHPLADRWLQQLGVNRLNLPDSLIFIHQKRVYVQAAAVLQIGRMMGGVFLPLSYLGKLIPFKNNLYGFIARHRRKIKADCPMPSPAFRAKVLG